MVFLHHPILYLNIQPIILLTHLQLLQNWIDQHQKQPQRLLPTNSLADLLSSGEESDPYGDSGSSFQSTDNRESYDDNSSKEFAEQSSDEDNQFSGTITNPVTTNDIWVPCGQFIND